MSQETIINNGEVRTRKFQELTLQQRNEHHEKLHKAFVEKNSEETSRLTKMYEFSYQTAKGIQLTFGQTYIEGMKQEGYLFPEGF